jgi:hypothetical protein
MKQVADPRQALEGLEVIREDHEGSLTNPDDSPSESTVSGHAIRNKKEAKLIRFSRITVLFVLLLSALVVASLAYVLISQGEKEDFQTNVSQIDASFNIQCLCSRYHRSHRVSELPLLTPHRFLLWGNFQFSVTAERVIHVSTNNFANMIFGIRTMVDLFPTIAREAGETLPFVTMDNFESFGSDIRVVSKAPVIAFTPLLKTKADLVSWNAYSLNHTDWVARGRDFIPEGEGNAVAKKPIDEHAEEHGDDQPEEIELTDEITKYVYVIDSTGQPVPEDGSGPFTPIWQTTPVPSSTSMINFNMASNLMFRSLLNYSLATGQPILSEPTNLADVFGNALSDIDGSHLSIFLHPVFDGFEHEEEREIVGSLVTVLPWLEFFDDASLEAK